MKSSFAQKPLSNPTFILKLAKTGIYPRPDEIMVVLFNSIQFSLFCFIIIIVYKNIAGGINHQFTHIV